MLPQNMKLKPFASELRNNAALHENRLWYEFLRGGIDMAGIRRQLELDFALKWQQITISMSAVYQITRLCGGTLFSKEGRGA